MHRRGWTKRALLATAIVAGGAASCASQAEPEGLDEEKCYSSFPEPGDLHVSGFQTAADGTEQPVEALSLEASKSHRRYTLVWQSGDLEYRLTFVADTEKSGTLVLQDAELCTEWVPWVEYELPACATSTGPDRCEPGCGPATGAGHVQVTMECDPTEEYSYDQRCYEEADGQITVRGATMGQFRGSLQFSITTHFQEQYCSTATFEELARGCSR